MCRFIRYFYPKDPYNFFLLIVYVFYGNILIVALMLGWD
jgi:hypothetical protein